MKLTLKKIFLLCLLATETVAFAWMYRYGTYGSQALHQLRQETATMQHEVDALQREVDDLEHEVVSWQSHSFYKEKIAREQLQMARVNDVIYYIS